MSTDPNKAIKVEELIEALRYKLTVFDMIDNTLEKVMPQPLTKLVADYARELTPEEAAEVAIDISDAMDAQKRFGR